MKTDTQWTAPEHRTETLRQTYAPQFPYLRGNRPIPELGLAEERTNEPYILRRDFTPTEGEA